MRQTTLARFLGNFVFLVNERTNEDLLQAVYGPYNTPYIHHISSETKRRIDTE